MKLLLSVSVLLASVAGPAFAADMPLKAPLREAPIVNDWTGFYIGIHGGYGWGRTSFEPDLGIPLLITSLGDGTVHLGNPKPRGFVFGGQAGYNWQWSSWVGGLEIDYSAANIKGSSSVSVSNAVGEGIVNTITATRSVKFDALASARARLGFLVTPGALLYGTAGLAWAHTVSDDVLTPTCTGIGCDVPFASLPLTANGNHFGWVAGGGLEFMLTRGLLLRVEGLHYDFGKDDFSFHAANATGGIGLLEGNIFGPTHARTSVDVVRGALSWKF